MKYDVLSTSKSGYGKAFTNSQDANDNIKQRHDSVAITFERMPRVSPLAFTHRADVAEDSEVNIFTDGSCIGGSGGYSAIMIIAQEIHELSESCISTTSNRMKMMAAITILEILEESYQSINIFTNDKFIIDSINDGWVYNWRKNGWKKSHKKPVQNIDLWEKVLELSDHFPNLVFKWVAKQKGNLFHERAEKLARDAAKPPKRFNGREYVG